MKTRFWCLAGLMVLVAMSFSEKALASYTVIKGGFKVKQVIKFSDGQTLTSPDKLVLGWDPPVGAITLKKGTKFTNTVTYTGGSKPMTGTSTINVFAMKLDAKGNLSGGILNLTGFTTTYFKNFLAPQTVTKSISGKVNLSPGKYMVNFDTGLSTNTMAYAPGSYFRYIVTVK